MSYVIEPQAATSLPVEGEQATFPVRRVYCVGRNYADHAREMGHDPDREPPFFFSKPADAVFPVAIGTAGELPYPPQTADLHYEVELVVALAAGGRDIPAAQALDKVYGYALGLDMTRRDLQAQAKKLGRPWDAAKGFDKSGPIGPIRPVAKAGHPSAGAIWLEVDGETRQRGDLKEMIWPVADTIASLSTLFELKAGDLIFTGTPAGVGPVKRGQTMRFGVDELYTLEVKVR
ncbi:fumarylacetoacetate hydrolase family protein [Chitinasiproducens palmae]|uniref:Fumarylpyruvate hydrolase n=1 Tax=Chitinasiproducens palmae TaxID=1770053 RepID=A0A1H2PNI0_9BURK|nr:fumarylacetoacetate hydrolase family protein [Chitinasiproducens palmae]SDV48226.1 fumarylpyruvate hydrolase [Chitinasiproducens palmae]